ncbi:replication protein A 70 kDa DNA-binding subunit A-like [Forsythia ovata]|uniref:Replication protein A 70 kDa DNA-binding subunit A-like n=1 Tax=Forsythia ovata TaxID=205694 RepID=A0ABD1VJQ0_9LAMI
MEINPSSTDADELQQRFKSFVCGKRVLHILPPTKRMREAPMVDLKDIIEENIIELFCTFKATIIKVINKEQPWYENCKTCNGRVYSRTEYDTTLCEKCENKKSSFIRKPILKLVVSDGIDEAHVTLFDASDYLIGCTLSEYAEDMKKEEEVKRLSSGKIKNKGKFQMGRETGQGANCHLYPGYPRP